MEDSAEIKTLRCAYDHLVNTISVDSVLPAARAAELITVRDYENCKAEPTACKQAESFVVCVEKAVIADPGKFDSFLSILGQCGQKSIAEYLRKLRSSLMLRQDSTGKYTSTSRNAHHVILHLQLPNNYSCIIYRSTSILT